MGLPRRRRALSETEPGARLARFAFNSMNYFCAFGPECVVARRCHGSAIAKVQPIKLARHAARSVERLAAMPTG